MLIWEFYAQKWDFAEKVINRREEAKQPAVHRRYPTLVETPVCDERLTVIDVKVTLLYIEAKFMIIKSANEIKIKSVYFERLLR